MVDTQYHLSESPQYCEDQIECDDDDDDNLSNNYVEVTDEFIDESELAAYASIAKRFNLNRDCTPKTLDKKTVAKSSSHVESKKHKKTANKAVSSATAPLVQRETSSIVHSQSRVINEKEMSSCVSLSSSSSSSSSSSRSSSTGLNTSIEHNPQLVVLSPSENLKAKKILQKRL